MKMRFLMTLFVIWIGAAIGYMIARYLQDQRQAELEAMRFTAPPPPSPPQPVSSTPKHIPLPEDPPEVEKPEVSGEVEAKASTEPSAPDQLTDIKGIGPTFAKRLLEAGITTFAQIADTPAEKLTEITKIRDWQRPNADDWIEEARSKG